MEDFAPASIEHAQEGRLITRCLDGDADAFGTLAGHHAGRIRRYFLNRGVAGDDAEDLTQDTLLNAFLGLGSFRGAVRLSSWMFGIARRVYVDWLRQGCRREVAVDEVPLAVKAPDLSACDLRIVVRRGLHSLPAHYRSVLILKDIEGMTLAETAETLGVPDTTVVNWLARARRRMKALLVAEGVGVE